MNSFSRFSKLLRATVLPLCVALVAGEAHGTGFIGAFDKSTGKEVWRRPRTPDRDHANYATPVVVQLAGRPQLIIGGWHLVSSYDPKIR